MAMKTTISPHLLLSLEKALQRLPGVMPRKARAMVMEAHDRLETINVGCDLATVELGGHEIAREQLQGVILTDDWGTPKVTPEGAAFLIELYHRGAFPMKRKTQPPAEETGLDAYAASRADLEQKQASKHAEEERRRHLIENPDDAEEADLSYYLLNDIFFRHRGPGSHEMTIGGIRVTKQVRGYRSNSGKSSDASVTFEWSDARGNRHRLEKTSFHEGNRRNDRCRFTYQP